MPTTIDCSAALLTQLGQLHLLPPAALAELTRAYPGHEADPRGLARHLLGQGWLTPYQINQVFAGRGAELVLGTYVILERLGEGGMARVFKARHQRIDRLVALKIVRAEFVKNAEAVRRFRREVRAAAQLSHPNIVLGLDADEVNGTHFLVMEYVGGIDLARLVKGHGPLAVPQACDYVRQAALGLQHAHEKGMVHRDIKPSNLLVTTAPRREEDKHLLDEYRWGLVKLLDMGLALCAIEEPGDSATLTHAGELIGTPEYLSPEQAANPHDADIRADLYSLGCTFYYLLTGAPPFPGGTAIEKLFQHRLEEARPVEQLRPEVPAELAGILRRLMAKQPQDRFAEPRELALALAPWCDPATEKKATPLPILSPVSSAWSVGDTLSALPNATAVSSKHEKVVVPARSARSRRTLVPTILGGLVLIGCLGGFLLLLSRQNAASPTEKVGPDTPEQRARVALQRLMAKAEQPKADLRQLRQELVNYRWQFAGSDAAHQATELIGQFSSPLDRFDAKDVPIDARFGGHAGGELVLVQGDGRLRHGLPVYSVALSPDGRTALSGGEGRHVGVWEVASGTRLASLEGATLAVTAVACSPDGQVFAAASNDGTVRLWNAARLEKERAVLRHPSAVRALAFSSDNRLLATGSSVHPGKHGGAVRLWDVGSGKELFALEGFHGAAIAVAFAPGNQMVASGGDDRTVHLWDVGQRKEVGSLGNHQAHVMSLAFAADGQTLFSGCADRMLRAWDVAQRKERSGAQDFGQPVAGIAVVPNGPLLVLALHDGTLRLWDSGSAQEKGCLRGHQGGIHAVAVSANGQLAVSAGQDGIVRRWDLAKQQELRLDRPGDSFSVQALAPDDHLLATGQPGGRVRLWDLTTNKPIGLPDRHQFGVASLAFSPDGKGLLSGGADHTAILWDLAAGRERYVLRGHHGHISAVAFGGPSSLLLTASHDGTAKLWDSATGKEKATLSGHTQGLWTAAFAPDGKTVATVSSDRTLKFWDTATAKEKPSTTDVFGEALAFAPDRYLAAGAGANSLRFWDVNAPRPVEAKLFTGTAFGWAKALAYSPDGRTLVVAGTDGTVVFWNVTTGREVRRWAVPAAVTGLAYAADGRHLVCLLSNGTLAVFRLAQPPDSSHRPHWSG